MSDEKENASICVSLDLKKFRIRIHRHLLQMLGRPAYIQLMVNPKTKVLAIASGDQHDHLSHRVDWAALEGKASYELYSVTLYPM